ncbi:MAG: response regulator [Chlamydiota bacterium]|nr:response regulator [Chlamydiota bacterium]
MQKITTKYNAKVLLVEDYILNLQLATEMLELMDCVVDPAESGQEALEQFDSNVYDIIFMDINMPDMDGIQVTKLIRAKEKEAGKEYTPIVAITGMSAEVAKEKCIEAGMNDFISKPLMSSDLDRVLSKLLQEHSNPL